MILFARNAFVFLLICAFCKWNSMDLHLLLKNILKLTAFERSFLGKSAFHQGFNTVQYGNAVLETGCENLSGLHAESKRRL
jgi:hypothetical protein